MTKSFLKVFYRGEPNMRYLGKKSFCGNRTARIQTDVVRPESAVREPFLPSHQTAESRRLEKLIHIAKS